MAMKELLRISMSARQVREACEVWAITHSTVKDATVDAKINSDGSAEVVFNRKRERKAKENGQ